MPNWSRSMNASAPGAAREREFCRDAGAAPAESKSTSGELARISAAADDDVLRCPECGAILLRVKDFDR